MCICISILICMGVISMPFKSTQSYTSSRYFVHTLFLLVNSGLWNMVELYYFIFLLLCSSIILKLFINLKQRNISFYCISLSRDLFQIGAKRKYFHIPYIHIQYIQYIQHLLLIKHFCILIVFNLCKVFYTWGNWNSEKLSVFSKVTQLVSGRLKLFLVKEMLFLLQPKR